MPLAQPATLPAQPTAPVLDCEPARLAVLAEMREAAAANAEARKALNPFLRGLEINTRARGGARVASEALFDENGNPVETRHVAVYHLDKAEFVKLMAASFRDLFDLSAVGLRMFFVVCELAQREPNKDEVRLNWRELATGFHFRGNTATPRPFDLSPFRAKQRSPVDGEGMRRVPRMAFYRGIADLIAAQIIAPQPDRKEWYWLNPARMWNGERVSFVRSFLASPEAQDIPEEERPRIRQSQQFEPAARSRKITARGAERRGGVD